MGVQKHFTGSLVVGDDEGRVMEFESHTEKQTALVMLARRDVVDLENQVPFRMDRRVGQAAGLTSSTSGSRSATARGWH